MKNGTASPAFLWSVSEVDCEKGIIKFLATYMSSCVYGIGAD